MKNRFSSLMILFLCAALLLIGCDVPEGGSESDTETEREGVSETEFNTLSESESESETEEKSNTTHDLIDPIFLTHSRLGASQALVIRWGAPLNEQHEMGYPMEHEGLIAVEIELLRVYRRTFEYVRPYVPEKEVNDISVIYLPIEALTLAPEGEEALVFLSQSVLHTDGETSVRLYAVEELCPTGGKDEEKVDDPRYAIFSVTNDTISVPETHLGYNRGELPRCLVDGNSYIKLKGDDPSYSFRDGMTLDQLEQFFYLTRASRP